jgi:hypothetical protein
LREINSEVEELLLNVFLNLFLKYSLLVAIQNDCKAKQCVRHLQLTTANHC